MAVDSGQKEGLSQNQHNAHYDLNSGEFNVTRQGASFSSGSVF